MTAPGTIQSVGVSSITIQLKVMIGLGAWLRLKTGMRNEERHLQPIKAKCKLKIIQGAEEEGGSDATRWWCVVPACLLSGGSALWSSCTRVDFVGALVREIMFSLSLRRCCTGSLRSVQGIRLSRTWRLCNLGAVQLSRWVLGPVRSRGHVGD